MRIPLYQVDAFTSRPFSGNPAAVCPLEAWMDDQTLQAIAAENNLAETAFFVPLGDRYHLRWFTPTVEVDLCGHATLASAFVLFTRLQPALREVRFESRAGELIVRRREAAHRGAMRGPVPSRNPAFPPGETAARNWSEELLELDFPSRPAAPCPTPAALAQALGAEAVEVLAARDYLVVLESEEKVRGLRPQLEEVAALDRFAVIVTAAGSDCDFVSRFFAPAQGVPEDPVTGSAHCTLVPYWAARLGKKQLFARQVSRRGGELWCEDRGARTAIAGRAVLVLEGFMFL